MPVQMMNSSENISTSINNLHPEEVFIDSCIINLFLSVPTNIYVLWLIVNGAQGTMASEFFALNLAVCEILFNLFSISVIFIGQTKATLIANFGVTILNTGRPLFQSCICVERYLAVVQPVIFLKYKPLRYRVGCCAVAWMLVLGFCFYSMLLVLYYGPYSPIYNYTYLVQNLILTLVMLFCCFSVLRILKQPGPGGGHTKRTNNVKMRAFKIILIILWSMLLSNLTLIVIVSISWSLDPVEQYLSNCISMSVTVINGFVQPLLYLHRAGKLPFIKAL